MQKNFTRGEKKIIQGIKKRIVLLKSDDEFDEQQTSKKFNKKELFIKPTKTDMNKFNELIIKKEADMNRELFQEYRVI